MGAGEWAEAWGEVLAEVLVAVPSLGVVLQAEGLVGSFLCRSFSLGVLEDLGGLLSLLFLIVIVYFVYKTLRSSRRWGQGRSSKGRGLGTGGRDDNSTQSPVDLNGRPITNSDSLQRFGQSINFTRENMRYFAETFPRWDRDSLIGRVRQVFFWLQDGWSRQDLSVANDYLATTLGNKYKADLQAMKARWRAQYDQGTIIGHG